MLVADGALRTIADSDDRIAINAECNSWPQCYRAMYADDEAHQECRLRSRTCYPNSGVYLGSTRALMRAMPALQELADRHGNDQAALSYLYLARARHGLNATIDGQSESILSLHDCIHSRKKTRDCHYLPYDPLLDVRFEGAALVYQFRRLPARRPFIVHSNGDHSRLQLLRERAENSSGGAPWCGLFDPAPDPGPSKAALRELRRHPVLLTDGAAGEGLCSLSTLGALAGAESVG
eukprot:2137206-Prymnesium_polylepis.1